MAVVRLIVLLLFVLMILAVLAWMVTGNRRYKRFALLLLKWTLGAALLMLLLLAADRIIDLIRS